MLRYITSCLLGVTVAPSGVVEAGGGGWRRRFEGGRSKARGQVNGSRGTRPDNGVLCEDGKFDGESLSSPSDGRPTALLYLKGVGGGRRGPRSARGLERRQTTLSCCAGANRDLLWALLVAWQLCSQTYSHRFTGRFDRFTDRFYRFTGRFDRFEIQKLPCNRFTGRFDRFDRWAFMGRPIFFLFLF